MAWPNHIDVLNSPQSSAWPGGLATSIDGDIKALVQPSSAFALAMLSEFWECLSNASIFFVTYGGSATLLLE